MTEFSESQNAERLQAIADNLLDGVSAEDVEWLLAQNTELRAERDVLNESDLARSATVRRLRQENTELRDAVAALINEITPPTVLGPTRCPTWTTFSSARAVLDKWKDAR